MNDNFSKYLPNSTTDAREREREEILRGKEREQEHSRRALAADSGSFAKYLPQNN